MKKKLTAWITAAAMGLSMLGTVVPQAALAASAAGSIQVEHLDRGISAINTSSGMLVSWRFLANDSDSAVFQLYRNNTLVYTSSAGESTCYLDKDGKSTDKYRVDTLEGGKVVSSADCTMISNQNYFQLNLDPPTSYQDLFDDKYAGMVALPDMTSTAGPYMLVAMAEAMGGSQEDVTPAMELMQEKKDNINLWYTTSSDVVNALTTGEANITVFMDINMPDLMESGLNMVWVDAAEGSFAAPATVNVVKGCQNPELAQLFVEYMISDEVQSRVAEIMNEAPVNKNATMPDELKTYLAFGEDAMSALKQFDETYIASAKDGWIDTFQRTVNIQ